MLARLPPGVGAALRTAAELGQMRHLERFLAVPGRLAELFPDGLARGRVFVVRGGAALSVAAAMVSEATRGGSWLAIVDLDSVGYGALEEAGVVLERTVAVRTGERGIDVMGAVVAGFDLVIAGALPQCTPAEARRFGARVRAESCVMIVVEGTVPAHVGVDVTVSCGVSRWDFDACARRRHVRVTVATRGPGAGMRSDEVRLP